jgi:NADPH:quinone reductase-like Zn-dependent oxidoreductase
MIMKAAVYSSFGGPEVLEVVEVPEPKMYVHQVRIRIKAAALNPADLGFQAGAVDALVDSFFPVIPGWDVAGIVEEAGIATTGFKPGDEVIGLVRGAIQRYGSYAERVAAEPCQLARKPANLDWGQAAGLPLAGLTAYQAVVHALDVREGETLLVHGAAGGVGHLAVQIAAARGASVIGTASESNHGYLRSLGVQPAAYGNGLADRVRALAPAGVDAVLDTAGRGGLAITKRIGTADVRAASIVNSDAVLDTAGRDALAITKRIGTADEGAASVVNSNSNRHPGTIRVLVHLDQADLEAVVELAEAGKLSVRVARSFPLDQAADAQRLLAEGHSGGKIVLAVA